MSDEQIAPWDDAWSADTLQMAYEESASTRDVASSLAEAIDTKVVAMFSVASAIIGLTPSLHGAGDLIAAATHPSPWRLFFYFVGAVAWVYVAIQCYRAYRPHDFAVGPNPNKALNGAWLRLTPAKYKYYAIKEMGRAHEINASHILRRGALIRWVMIATIVEVLSLGLAFLVF